MTAIIIKKNGVPIYEQIYEFFREEITGGSIICGSRLPSKRRLAADLCVSVNTVDAAYGQLVAEGYVEPMAKKGYFVCQIDEYRHIGFKPTAPEPVLSNADTVNINFSPSDVDYSIFPYDTFKKIFKNIFGPDSLAKTDPQGDPELRKALADLMEQSRGVTYGAERIIIGAGTDSLLQILAAIFGQERKIIFENPVYLKAYKIFENMGSRVIPVDVDDRGIIPERLIKHPCSVLYVTPSHQFPLGFSMPIDRRIKLLNYANENPGSYIIEDDYDSELRYNEKPLPPLASIDKSGKVIYMGTFSKSIAPSIRLSYMALPEPLFDIYQEKFGDAGAMVSGFEQKMLAEFISLGGFEKHINKMRKVYKDKRKLLLSKLGEFGDSLTVMGENAGHHLLVKLNTGLSEQCMCERALAQGVKVYPLSPHFVGGVTKKYEGTVLLGYGALSLDQITLGVSLLSRAWGIEHFIRRQGR